MAWPELAHVAHEGFVKEYGAGVTARSKLALMRESCETHASSPRVAVFRHMTGWAAQDGDGDAWDASRKEACMQLVGWLQIANAKPPPGDSQLEMPLSNINALIQNLVRKQMVPKRAAQTLKEAAEAIELPFDEIDETGEP